MNTQHFQMNTAYLDGALMSLDGEKVVIITYADKQSRFFITRQGEVTRCGDEGPAAGNESDFEVYRMSFLEALISGGSLIIRQVEADQMQLPESLGGSTVPVDYLCGAEVGPKGIRGLRAEELKDLYPQGSDGAVQFRSFPSKDQVKIALLKRVEEEAEEASEAVSP